MKNPAKQPSLKELRTALNVLTTLDVKAPEALLVELTDRIFELERVQKVRRMNRMTEEEIIKYEGRQRTTLRVTVRDGLAAGGRLLQAKNNGATFMLALLAMDVERAVAADYRIRRNPLFIKDNAAGAKDGQVRRRRIKNYVPLLPGLYVYMKTTAAEKKRTLEFFDELFGLNWEIDVV